MSKRNTWIIVHVTLYTKVHSLKYSSSAVVCGMYRTSFVKSEFSEAWISKGMTQNRTCLGLLPAGNTFSNDATDTGIYTIELK